MTNKVCTQCGRKIFTKCPEPSCQVYWQNHWEQKVDKKINDYQIKIEELQQKETNELTTQNYSEVKKIQQEVKRWESELKNSSF